MFRRHDPLAACCLLTLSIACGNQTGGGDAAKGADAKTADAKTADAKTAEAKTDEVEAGDDGKAAADGEPTPEAGGEVDIDEATREQLKADAAKVREHLGTAREKFKTEDWKGAIAAYAEAAKIDDDNPRILGELGWSKFNDGDLDGAEHDIRHALRFEDETKHRASLLFQLGRIEEERGDYASAKEHYDHSLELEDDAEASKHDEAVGDKAAASCAGGKCTKPDYVDLKAACDGMLERVHHQLGLELHAADDEFSCSPDAARKVPLSGGDATEAAVLVIKGSHAGTEEEEHDLLVHIEGGWHWVGTLLDLENPHHGGIARTGSIDSFEAKELIPDAAGEEILLHVKSTETDADLDENILYKDEHEAYVVCSVNAGAHECYEIPSRLAHVSQAIDATQETSHDLASHDFSATVEFDGKGSVLYSGEGEVPEEQKGKHTITELTEPDGFVFLHED